jgi:ATP-dependent Lon protease
VKLNKVKSMGEHEFQVLPALPLKNTILFPGLLLPLSVGRESSIQAVQAALKTEEKEIILVAQRDSQTESPERDDLYTIGTKAVIRKSSRQGDGMMEILVLGVERIVVVKFGTVSEREVPGAPVARGRGI